MRGFAILMILASAGIAQAADKPEFIFDGKVFRSVEHPEEYVEIGETLSLLELGRRFASYNVSAEYFIDGDYSEERILYRVKQNEIEFEMLVESDKIYYAYTYSKGIAGANGAQVGDGLPQALGETAYCDLNVEDKSPYCKESEDAALAYYVFSDDKCTLDEGRVEQMPTPACGIVALTSGY
jgi:hypothetical protein